MPYFIEYLLKLSICLGAVYLFYQLLLRKLTFYNWNRWYLLGYSLLSFIIPFIDIMPSLEKRQMAEAVFVQWIPAVTGAMPQETFWERITLWQVVLLVFFIIALALLVKFLLQLLSLKQLQSKAVLINEENDVKIYQVHDDIVPFSFGNAMYVNINNHTDGELQEIIRHEFVHIKQQHTADVLLVELLCIINWFNPFAWLIKRAVKQNLEFIADRKVIAHGIDKKQYQYLLLKVMGNREFAFATNFNFTSLKKRIMMMNKNKTAQLHVARFLFLLPVLAVLLLSFRSIAAKIEAQEALIAPNEENLVSEHIATDTVPEKKAAPLTLQKVVEGKKTISINIKDTIRSGEKPLVVVNGVPQEYQLFQALNPEAIESISVLKDASATSLYGDEAKYGVLLITTKKPSDPGEATVKIKGTVVYTDTIKEVVVKGYKKVDTISLKGRSAAFTLRSKVDGDSIRYENLDKKTIKGEKYAVSNAKAIVVQGYKAGHSKKNLDEKADPYADFPPDALYILDGNEIKLSTLSKFPVSNIKEIAVYKDNKEAVLKKYGEKAKNGVVEITTK